MKVQVRNPLAQMPAFNQVQITDAQLDQIAAYIESLAPGMAYVEPAEMQEAVAMHHWMALASLAAGNMPEASHHVVHIIDLVADNPEHLAQMESVLEAINSGNVHGAEHPIETMLVGTAERDLTLTQMHIRLALYRLESRQMENLRHHLEHFINEATGTDKSKGQEILDLIGANDLATARHEMEELLGLEGHTH